MASIAKTITVDQLAKLVKDMQNKGFGKKKIMISSDDEGNEYHELFFGFSENARDVFSSRYGLFMPCGVTEENVDDYVILG